MGGLGVPSPLQKDRDFGASPEVESSFFTLAGSFCHPHSVGRVKEGSSTQSKDEEDKDEDEEGFTRL